MSRERLLRIDDEFSAFDWSRAARELDVPTDVARSLYLRAIRITADPARAEMLYRRWLREAAGARPRPAATAAPGRQTRVRHEAGDASETRRSRDRDRLAPGRSTRVLLEARRHDARVLGTEAVDRAVQVHASNPSPAPGHAALVGDDRSTAVDAQVDRAPRPGAAGRALASDLAARFAPHVGPTAVGAARLHTDEAADQIAASHRARALTIGTDIFFARGEYTPGTVRGDELLAHELTHVAQGQRGELMRAAAKGIDSGGPLDPAEAEADLRARLAVLQLHPPETVLPTLAQPAAQPTSEADRAAMLAAQQQRITLADQTSAPLVVPAAAPVVTPQAPIAHPAPSIVSPPASPSTDNAYVAAFEALPSRQALELWPSAGTRATALTAAEQARFDAGLPPMPIVLAGNAAPTGAAAGGAGPGQAPAGGNGSAAGALPADASTGQPAAPATAAEIAQQAIAAVNAILAALAAPPPDPAQAQADGQAAIDSLPTTAPAVQTNPGTAPMTDLSGQTDPVRAVADRQNAVTDGTRALDDARTRIVTGPGAAQIQPVKLDDKLPVPAEQPAGPMPALPAVDGMAKLKGWNLPGNAQSSFDAIAKPKLDANLVQARLQMTQADTTRDTDRANAVADSQDKVKQAHTDADQQQQIKVAETRARIAGYQADTLLKQENEVKKLDTQAGDQKKTTVGKINDRLQTDQAKVDRDYKDAQKRADDRKQQGEAEAAQKKRDAQDQANSQSWWDQLVGAISDAINQIASEITQVLDGIATAVGQILDEVKTAACQVIDATRDFVCQTLTELGDWLKSAVDALIGSVFPELAAALDRRIDDAVSAATTAVNAVADDLKAGVTALCDGLKAAIDGVIAAFKTAVQAAATLAQAAITGDWSLAARMVIDGILAALGIDPAAFYALIGKAEDSIEKIVENPGAFVGHLIDAVKLGFRQFGDNFWTYLQDGVVQWLFGTFSQAGIQMPASFDIAGIFDLVCQILGLTWPRLRGKVVAVIGEANAGRLEFVAGYLQALVTGGFAGLWDKIQQDLSNLWDMVVGGIKDWLIQNVVQQAILKLATMWNPIGAIFELIQTAWNAYQWLRENAQRIFGLVEAVVNSISSIVAGDISGAANLVESSLAKLVPIAISLFADLLGLGGIADQMKQIIGQVQALVDQAIDALIQRVKALFKDNKGAGHGDTGDAIKHFSDKDGTQHELTVHLTDGVPDIKVASNNPTGVQHQIQTRRAAQPPLSPDQAAALDRAWALYDTLVANARKLEPGEDVGVALQADMTLLSQELVAGTAWANGDVPDTLVTFGGSGGTKSVLANPLTRRPGNTVGSPAEDVLPGWTQQVGQQTPGAGGNLMWRRVHLLGDMLHGPGNNPQNLVPGSAMTNQQLRNGPEKAALDAIVAGDTLRYEVTATPHATKPFFPGSMHVRVTRLAPGTGTLFDRAIQVSDPPTGSTLQFTAAQQAVIDAYEALRAQYGRTPTQQEVLKHLDKKGKGNISMAVSEIRRVVAETDLKTLDDAGRQLIERARAALDLP